MFGGSHNENFKILGLTEIKILHHKVTFIPLHNLSIGLNQECETCHDINSCVKYRDKYIMSTYWKSRNTQHHCKGKAY
jgi:hypothetical protein